MASAVSPSAIARGDCCSCSRPEPSMYFGAHHWHRQWVESCRDRFGWKADIRR
jgi:hypothetical protein